MTPAEFARLIASVSGLSAHPGEGLHVPLRASVRSVARVSAASLRKDIVTSS